MPPKPGKRVAREGSRRGGPLDQAVDAFLSAARAERVILMNRSGRLLVQRGFDDARQIVEIASLAAGIHATGKRIGQLVGDPEMAQAHNRGTSRAFMLSELSTPSGPILILTVFGTEPPGAHARQAFEVFARTLGSLAGLAHSTPVTAETFEASLNASLERLFPAR